MVAAACVSLALVLNGCFQHLYSMQKGRGSIHTKRFCKRPVHRSAFSFMLGAKSPSRIGGAWGGGEFGSAEVDDVKTFLCLLAILFSILIVCHKCIDPFLSILVATFFTLEVKANLVFHTFLSLYHITKVVLVTTVSIFSAQKKFCL